MLTFSMSVFHSFAHLFAKISPSHSHLIIPPSQGSVRLFSIPLFHFYHSSLGELIASSFVLGEQRGTMAEWGSSLWQQAWDKREREGDKEERHGEKERAQRGCWLLAGRRGSERWLITLVSMHTAIKPWCTHTHTRLCSEYPTPATHILPLSYCLSDTHFLLNIREKEQVKRGGGSREGEAGKQKKK